MSKYVGDFLVGKTVRLPFNTVNAAGVPTTLTTGTVSIAKDGADVTPSGGVTLSVDVSAVTGRHHVVIDLSVDSATFTAGSDYVVRLAGTSSVGGTSVVGSIVGHFSIQNRSGATVAGILTTQMTESYNADGVAPTLAQAIFLVMQRLTDFTIEGSAINIHKLDGTTTAYTLTLDKAPASTGPLSSSRTS